MNEEDEKEDMEELRNKLGIEDGKRIEEKEPKSEVSVIEEDEEEKTEKEERREEELEKYREKSGY